MGCELSLEGLHLSCLGSWLSKNSPGAGLNHYSIHERLAPAGSIVNGIKVVLNPDSYRLEQL